MSAKSELKARSAVRAKKRDQRKLGKRKRKNGLDDDEDSGDEGGDDTAGLGYLPTPAQVRAQEQGANVVSAKRKKRKSKEERTSGHAPGQTSITISKLPKQDFSAASFNSFQKVFWTGPPGEDPPSEELKQQRKALGVICRGQLAHCPPPIDSVSSAGLPPSFASFFKTANLKKPSVVQQQCWPAALGGLNILGIAPTGSGKTLAYTMPMIPHIQSRVSASSSSSSSSSSHRPSPKALVIVPTRELALQVVAAMKPMHRLFNIKAVAIYGGEDREKQIEQLSISSGGGTLGFVVVATPGRLLDLISARSMTLTDVTYLVIDEADRMLAMGFADQLTAIASQMRPSRQTLLFSATFPGKLRDSAITWCGEACMIKCNTIEMGSGSDSGSGSGSGSGSSAPLSVKSVSADESPDVAMEVGEDNAEEEEEEEEEGEEEDGDDADVSDVDGEAGEPDEKKPREDDNPSGEAKSHTAVSSLTVSDAITQHVHVCVPHKRPRLLIKYILRVREKEKIDKVRQLGPMLIFCTRIKTVGYVAGFLKSQDVTAEVLHGQLQQSQREKVLNGFRAGKINILICTDVAARGIHIKNLAYVVNYDFPNNLEQYCHRIGRTGRQGSSQGGHGHAYSFFTRNLAPMAPDLLQLLRNCKQEPEPNLVELARQVTDGDFVLGDEDGEALGLADDEE